MADSTTIDITAAAEARRLAQEETLRSPRRRYSLAAKALFALLDTVYGKKDTLRKFRVLEIVARVPYQAWEHVAYVAVTHTHEDPDFARGIHERVAEARAQQDNEQWHLLILEELLDRRGHRHSFWRDRIAPQVGAYVFYHITWLLYVVRPKASYRLNADMEDHAEHAYMGYVADHPELEHEPWHSSFADEYGDHPTLADLLRSIALDEREHKHESEERMRNPRFSRADIPPDHAG